MAVKLSPIWVGQQFLTASGLPLSGGKILQYTAGTTTLTATYTDSTGITPNANPIILDSAGRYSSQIWFTSGTNYKLVLQDSGGSTLLTEDNLTGVNDSGSATPSEWVVTGLTPTYISATQFSLVGNQTANFQVGRRLQITVNAGTVYGSITASSFGGGITTVTVVLDSGALDVGISVVNYGLLGISNESVPYTYTTKPAFFASRAGNQTSGTTIIYNSVINQQGGSNVNTSTGVFTAPISGFYILCANATVSNTGGAAATFDINIVVNAVIVASGSGATNIVPATTGFGESTASVVVFMTAGQTASVICTALSASFFLIPGASQQISFSGALLF